MPLVAPPPSNNFTPAPEGNHIARCFRMVDIGTQKRKDFKTGEVYDSRMVRLDFELPDETHTFREEKGPEPFTIGNDYTFSMSNKANLRKHLEQWRNKKFTDEEANAFNIEVLLGIPCMLNVIHKESGGKVYSNIASFAPLPKALKGKEPAPVNQAVAFSIDDFITAPDTHMRAYLALPDFIKKKIQASKEWPKIAPLVGDEGGNDESPWGEDEPQDRTDHSPKNQGRAPSPVIDLEDEDSIPF